MKSLKGFRIGVLVDYDQSDVFSENYAIATDRRKWREIRKDQVILKLPIFQHAPRFVHICIYAYINLYFFHMNRPIMIDPLIFL